MVEFACLESSRTPRFFLNVITHLFVGQFPDVRLYDERDLPDASKVFREKYRERSEPPTSRREQDGSGKNASDREETKISGEKIFSRSLSFFFTSIIYYI